MGDYNDLTAPLFQPSWLVTAAAPRQSGNSWYPFLDLSNPPPPGGDGREDQYFISDREGGRGEGGMEQMEK